MGNTWYVVYSLNWHFLTVMAFTRAILHDEVAYPKPFEFKPERFLKEDGKELPPDPAIVGAFGFGRR